jgi:hypothetical protein
VVAGGVDVDGLSRDHHGRGGVPGQRQQHAGMRRGVAEAVDQQVRTVAERGGELRGVVPVSGDEPAPGGGNVALRS